MGEHAFPDNERTAAGDLRSGAAVLFTGNRSLEAEAGGDGRLYLIVDLEKLSVFCDDIGIVIASICLARRADPP